MGQGNLTVSVSKGLEMIASSLKILLPSYVSNKTFELWPKKNSPLAVFCNDIVEQCGIGEDFVSSVYDIPCMYVRMFVIQDGM